VWEYCAKSELHPAAAGLEVLMAGRTSSVAKAMEDKSASSVESLLINANRID
jgi:hypothetical protein